MTDISNRKYCQIDKIRNDATIKRNEPTLTADICRSRLATVGLSNMAAKTASIDIERNYATVAVCIKTAIVTPPARRRSARLITRSEAGGVPITYHSGHPDDNTIYRPSGRGKGGEGREGRARHDRRRIICRRSSSSRQHRCRCSNETQDEELRREPQNADPRSVYIPTGVSTAAEPD